MLLSRVVETSRAVAATRARTAKTALLAGLLAEVSAAPGGAPGREVRTTTEVGLVATYLSGTLPQRRTGLGWRTVADVDAEPATEPGLAVADVHAALEGVAGLAGPGSQEARRAAWGSLLARATHEEQRWLRAVVVGEVRQGALDALLLDAAAQAYDVPVAAVRRAAMLAGSSVTAVEAAASGGEQALAAIGLEVGRPVRPMLASSAQEVEEAVAPLAGRPGSHAVDAKLDGIRVQVHRDGDEVRVWTRSLDEVTERLPAVVAVVRDLPAARLVLDGEALLRDPDGRARPFQETASRSATRAAREAAAAVADGPGTAADDRPTGPPAEAQLEPAFFDVLHVDGEDLLDLPARDRWDALERLVPPTHRVHRLRTSDPAEVRAFYEEAVAAGHEGVVVKDGGAPYAAGRRGAAWVKVKPRLTLDLVVLAVEWGSGRRRGLLSNIHLGARDPGSPAESPRFVMVGKTFKGMTDEVLAWQTERFLELETHREGHVVHVSPEQVVEVALDGAQRSPRYPGGVALRFARLVRYRDDKTPAEADPVTAVQDLLA